MRETRTRPCRQTPFPDRLAPRRTVLVVAVCASLNFPRESEMEQIGKDRSADVFCTINSNF